MKGKKKLARARRAGDREVAAHQADIRHEARVRFIHELAVFLAGNPAHMNILLEMRNEHAVRWAALRNSGPSLGWDDVDEAEKKLTEFLA